MCGNRMTTSWPAVVKPTNRRGSSWPLHLRKEAERAARKAPQDAAADAKGEAGEPASKKPREKEPRASTTDAQARVMKMADGGFRPAYNVQFATDTKSTA